MPWIPRSLQARIVAALSHAPDIRDDLEAAAEEVGADRDPGHRYQPMSTGGGTARVYSAHDVLLGRSVHVKLPRPGVPDAKESLLAEARRTATLDHPGIIPLLDLVDADTDVPRMVSRTAPGGRLVPPRTAVEVRGYVRALVRVCETVQFLHARGVVHHDLKPDNVALGAHGEVYLLDLGEARPVGSDAPDAWTPGWAPETEADRARTRGQITRDTWALGAMVWAAATGGPPATGSPARADHDELVTIANGALEGRWSAEQVGAGLTDWLESRPVREHVYPLWRRAGRWVTRHPVLVSVGGMLLLASVAVWSARAAERRLAEEERLRELAEAAVLERDGTVDLPVTHADTPRWRGLEVAVRSLLTLAPPGPGLASSCAFVDWDVCLSPAEITTNDTARANPGATVAVKLGDTLVAGGREVSRWDRSGWKPWCEGPNANVLTPDGANVLVAWADGSIGRCGDALSERVPGPPERNGPPRGVGRVDGSLVLHDETGVLWRRAEDRWEPLGPGGSWRMFASSGRAWALGGHLASGAREPVFVHTAAGQEAEFDVGVSQLRALGVSPSGDWLVAAGRAEWELWSVSPAARVARGASARPAVAARVGDSGEIALLFDDGATTRGRAVSAFEGQPLGPGPVSSLAVSPEGRLAAGSESGRVAAWDARGERLWTTALDRGVATVRWSPAGPLVIGTYGGDVVIGTTEGTRQLGRAAGSVYAMAFDGDDVLVGGVGRAVERLGEATLQEFPESVTTVRVDPEGGIWAADFGGRVRRPDGRVDPVPGVVTVGAFSPDPEWKRLAFGEKAPPAVKVFALPSLAESARLDGMTAWPLVVSFSPDGEWLAAGDVEGQVWVWDARDLVLIARIPAHRGAIGEMAWWGPFLYTAGGDGRIGRWDLSTLVGVR